MAKSNAYPVIKLLLPKAPAIFPKLNTPDTKFDPDGVYEVKLRYEEGQTELGLIGRNEIDLEGILERLKALRDEFADAKREELMAGDGKQKKKAKELTVRDIGEMECDDDTGEETGNLILKAKMKASGISKKDGKPWTRAPKLFDAKGKPFPAKAPAIYGGSVLKVAVEAVPYYAANDNVVGITLRLEAVQVIDLVSGGGRSASAYGFGSEDGYSAEEDVGDDAGSVDDSAAGDGGTDDF